MINIDICCCTYNSSKWLDTFFKAMCEVEYDKKRLHIYFTDNNSSDDTVSRLEQIRADIGSQFGSFEILQTGYNAGFGVGSNTSARKGNSDYIFFFNVDTAISPDAFAELDKAVQVAGDDIGAFEMRQLPYEHPKYYDPVTMETTWATGAALVVRRDIFMKTGGFDETIFMYCEDVDFSWRIRLAGYKILYVPSCTTQHFIDISAGMKPTEIAGQLAGERIMRLKYADNSELKKWPEILRMYQPKLQENEFAANLSKKLQSDIDKHEKAYRSFYNMNVKNSGFKPIFKGCFEFPREGTTYFNKKAEGNVNITIIIRTFNRPGLLALTLKSLCNQTEKSFKVIVVEDGENPVSHDTIKNFEDILDIQYIPVNRHVGRCAAGNLALENVKTQYAVFLDDDDYFFADYIEVITKLISDNPQCKMFCSGSISATTKKLNADGSEYIFIKKENVSAKNLGRVNFYVDNPVPIQAVVFDISLFNDYGGFDETLDAFEDWELWVKYATHSDIASVEKALSIFRVPADRTENLNRTKHFEAFRPVLYEKINKYKAEFSAQDIHSLKWTPDITPVYGEEDFYELKDIAKQLNNSTIYKLASPLRRLLYKLSDLFAKMAAYFGARDIAPDTEDYGTIQNFIIQTQDSSYMKNMSSLLNKNKR